MKLKCKALIINLFIPLSIGFLSGFLNRSGMEQFNTIVKPALTPPAYIFPIAWTVLYILMGISAYLITTSSATKEEKVDAFKIYALQLGMNFLWSFIFLIWEPTCLLSSGWFYYGL
jgi:Tryptophan-rich sensory protein (mitochondrial benzodiazepine receptor homolog)